MEREGCPEVAEETLMKVYAIRSNLVEVEKGQGQRCWSRWQKFLNNYLLVGMASQPLCFGKEKVGLLNNQNSTLEESENEKHHCKEQKTSK